MNILGFPILSIMLAVQYIIQSAVLVVHLTVVDGGGILLVWPRGDIINVVDGILLIWPRGGVVDGILLVWPRGGVVVGWQGRCCG